MHGWPKSPGITIVLLFALGACAPTEEPPMEPMEPMEEAAEEAPAEDVAEGVPEHGRLVLENDYVRALEFSLEPGEEIPLHTGLKRAVYSLSDYTLEWTEGGTTETVEWSKGDAHWHGAVEHAARNVGETEARYVTVGRTEAELPEPPASEAPPLTEAQAEGVRVALDNDDVAILEVTLEPGAEQPVHSGRHRFVYSLSDYSLSFECAEETTEQSFSAGDGHWHEAGDHCAENVGDTTAHYVVFGLKR